MTRRQDRSQRRDARRAWTGRATALALGVTTLIVPAGMATQAEAARVQPRTVSPTTTLAVIKTIPVGDAPSAVALNDADDTVYVTNDGTNNVSVINGRTGQRTDDTIAVGRNPNGVAVNQVDDTVYVANQGDDSVSVINGRTNTVASRVVVASQPFGVAIDMTDDTVYVANNYSTTVSRINARTNTPASPITIGSSPYMVAVDQVDDTVYVTRSVTSGVVSVINMRTNPPSVSPIGVGTAPKGVAVNQDDDTVYVVNSGSNNVSVINGRTGQRTDDTIAAGSSPAGVAVDQADDTVYVTNSTTPGSVTVINGRTGQRTDDTVTVESSPSDVAVDQSLTNAGLVYVTNYASDTVSVIGRVTPSLVAPCGSADDTATITLTVPNLATGFVMDPSTVTSVTFGTTVFTTGTGLSAASGNKWELRVPVGTGSVPVTVQLKGSSRTASAGNFTYGCTPPTPPTPTPPTPAGAPSDITATPGDNSATVTWKAPASSGDYPITDYRAIASPGGRSCLVAAPALTCEVTGLTSGTSYTFAVQALTGAGWGATSSPSNAVTPTPAPRPTITITGSRDGERIIVTGIATELTGKTLRPWRRFPGQATYTEGKANITPAADGTFTWKRKTVRKATTYVYIAHGATKSNTVTIPAR